MQIFRIAIVGGLFALFGALCLVGNVYFLSVVILRLHKLRAIQSLSRDIVRISWRFFIYATRILGYLRYEFINFDTLGAQKSQLIIANHPSLLDVVLILSRVKGANCVVKASLARNIFLFGAIKASGYILNTQNEALLAQSKNALDSGETLLIFPEGTRTRGEIAFHKAASYIAIHGAKTIAPIFITMRPRSLKKGGKWYETPKTTINYTLTKGEDIALDSFAKGKAEPLRVRELHEKLCKIYKEALKNEQF